MRTLVVEANEDLGQLWCRHLERQGGQVKLVMDETSAIEALRFGEFEALILDLMLPDASSLAICDFATYRHPDIAIIVVTSNNFFSDGSIFGLIPNARGFLHSPVQPDDLAALVEHYGRPNLPKAG